MRPDPQFPADFITFNEEILNGKLHFLCNALFFAEAHFDTALVLAKQWF